MSTIDDNNMPQSYHQN